MSRNLDTTMAAQLPVPSKILAFLVTLAFRSSTQYVWSGIGSFSYGGNTYTGVGSLGAIGDVSGGVEVQAKGTSVTLSGIDLADLQDSLTDIQINAPAKILFAFLTPAMQVIGAPYVLYAGTVGAPKVRLGTKTCSITIPIENRMIDLNRAQQQRYTAADQQRTYPTDTAFNWVEILNDLALKEGTA